MLSALSIAALLAAAPPPHAAREIENVAAFARLYGVVRYFYPSDAAAELDWNRFAVHGVGHVRPARDAAALAAALTDLVAPLGPGIEIGAKLPPAAAVTATADPLVAWRYLGAGFVNSGPYKARRTHRAMPTSTEGFATLMQSVPAWPLRGKPIRLRAKLRATATGPADGGALWVRVDRPDRVMGFFDNMQDRLVRDAEWRPYTVEGTVADDAVSVAFGVMAVGGVTADFDEVELAVKEATGDWTVVPIADPGFEATASDDAKGGWARRGTISAVLTRPADGAPEGRQFARFSPPADAGSREELFPEGAPRAGARASLDLGGGLRARVPLALTDAEARADAARKAPLETLRATLAAVTGPSAAPEVDQRLADVVVAWNAFRHFYPYWTETAVDWDARLRPRLEAARAADGRTAHRKVLQGLVADARDGHGFVRDIMDKVERAPLPVGLAVVEGRLVVTATSVPAEAPMGAAVTAIDGAPAADRLAQEMDLASGTSQWRQVKATWALTTGPKGGTVRLTLESGAGPREAVLAYGAAPPPPASRPSPVTEIEPGLWYVDVTRATMATIGPKLPALAAARAVVFDMRGYPTDAGAGLLPHLLAEPEADRWMHLAKVVGPSYETAGWVDAGWDVAPRPPRIGGRVVFLTDGGAISYAESVMGYVADRKLGTIVGGATAGTNGNVATFVTPGGFSIGFTGMRVTRHDGRSPHHLVGIAPDVAAAPTLEGLRAGRDEVLERGMEVARAATASPPRP